MMTIDLDYRTDKATSSRDRAVRRLEMSFPLEVLRAEAAALRTEIRQARRAGREVPAEERALLADMLDDIRALGGRLPATI